MVSRSASTTGVAVHRVAPGLAEVEDYRMRVSRCDSHGIGPEVVGMPIPRGVGVEVRDRELAGLVVTPGFRQ
jgi:hypothetical protein